MEESGFYERLTRVREEEKAAEEGRNSVTLGEEKPKVVTLPMRHGKMKHRIYGLDLSDPEWAEVADRIHESEERDWPEEPKPLSGKCKLFEKKALQALGVLEAKEDWGRMISEGCWWAYRRWVCAGGLKGIWVDGGPELFFRASKGCSNGISSFSPQETIVKVCSLDSRAFGTLVIYESRTLHYLTSRWSVLPTIFHEFCFYSCAHVGVIQETES
ncbi:hypothetical protein NC651_005075 [Populus alba x Populus x berolinensis]|nr:hypothetical protein NC651_005075 [Populus alba x Populus x berolinensis]